MATVLGLCALGALPATAEFECRIQNMVTSGYTAGVNWIAGESDLRHVYATVASNNCTDDAAVLSSRAGRRRRSGAATEDASELRVLPRAKPFKVLAAAPRPRALLLLRALLLVM